MTEIFNWIKDIAFYMILMTIIFNLVPNVSYQRYLKLFAGMILVILVISPLMGFLNLDERLEKYFLGISFTEEVNQLKPLLEQADDTRFQSVMGEYKSMITREIETRAAEEGLVLVSVDIQLCEDYESENFGALESISVAVAEDSYAVVSVEQVKIGDSQESPAVETETAETAMLREKLLYDYRLSEEKISVSMYE